MVDAATFEVLQSVNLSFHASCGSTILAGRGDRLYFGEEGRVKILDAGTGGIVGEFAVENSGPILAISPDNRYLYIAAYGTQPNIYKIDVSTDQARIVAQRSGQYGTMRLSSDGQRLYVLTPSSANFSVIEILNADDLSFMAQIFVPRIDPNRDEVFDLFATSSNLYVAFTLSVREASLSAAGRVVQFDAVTLRPLRNWNFVRVPAIVTSGNERYLYAFTDKARVIDLQ